MKMAFTLAIIKPDAVANPVTLKWISLALTRNNLVVTKGCRLRLSQDQASRLYKVHRDKFFYSRLIRHVCSGTSIIMRLELYENHKRRESKLFESLPNPFLKETKPAEPLPDNLAIKRWRKLLGPSKVFSNLRNVEESINDNFDLTNLRQYFAVSDTRNVAHGSDSMEELQKEYEIFEDLLRDVTNVESELFLLNLYSIPTDEDEKNNNFWKKIIPARVLQFLS